MTKQLTDGMKAALELLARNGFVVPGANRVDRGGIRHIKHSTIAGLERRGLVKIITSPDGGTMGVAL